MLKININISILYSTVGRSACPPIGFLIKYGINMLTTNINISNSIPLSEGLRVLLLGF